MGSSGASQTVMRPLMIVLLATLLLAAPASAARLQHTGPDVDFTVAATDVVELTVTGHADGDNDTITGGAGADQLHGDAWTRTAGAATPGAPAPAAR